LTSVPELHTAPEAVDLSIVMPCLDEAETIGSCIEKAKSGLASLGISGEIVVGDNGSTDGSQAIAERLGARVVDVAERGYGAALMGAIDASRGRYIIMADSDDSYDFREVGPFVDELNNGADLVVGCRLPVGGGRIVPGAMPWKHRWLGTPVLTMLSRLFFGTAIHDINCGMRGFRRDSYDRLELQTTGMEYASEMIIKAALNELRINEVPITLYPDGRSGVPHLRSWRDGWRHLRFMLLFSPRWLFLIPGLLLFAIGLGFGIPLAFKPVAVGSVVFDTNTLLVMAMAVIVGFQFVMFAVFAKVFAVAEGLLPPDARVAWLAKPHRMESGLLTGLVIAVAGVGLLFAAVAEWGHTDFGALSYADSLRIVIPGVTCIVLGVQLVFSSFFVGVLQLRRVHRRPPRHQP